MRPTSKYPLNDWMDTHKELRGSETWHLVDTLGEADSASVSAIRIEEDWEAWYADRSGPVPDLVECVAYYGYSRLLTQHWK